MAKTPGIAAAERAGIAHSVHSYEHDPKAESYGLEAAERLGVDPARVLKTLVVDLDGSLAVAVVQVEAQLDLRALGGKRSRMADPRDVERSTGYVLGGVSPLGQRRRLPTTVDESALDVSRVRHPRALAAQGAQVELGLDGHHRHLERAVEVDDERLEDPGRVDAEPLGRLEPVRLRLRVVLVGMHRMGDSGPLGGSDPRCLRHESRLTP